jgi:3-oxo-5-alpha-steroid 4-dehydrogenase 1
MSLSTYTAICIAWAVVAVGVVPYLLLRPAPYGRHVRPGFGPLVKARWAWLLMEAPSPLGMLLLFFLGPTQAPVAVLFLAMWLFHYVYRAFVFPFLLPGSAKPMPLAILLSAAFFNVVNAYLNGGWLFFLSDPKPLEWLTSPRFLVGAAMFIAGFLVHVLTDRELRRQRRGEVRVVPRGPLFRLVSCPNYFGEMVEWTGFAIATWSPGALLFALWTAANLVPRAIHHRAVVPFVL